jgi:hypothetical protein
VSTGSLGGPKVRDNWEDQSVGGRITLRWALGRYGSMGRTTFRSQVRVCL